MNSTRLTQVLLAPITTEKSNRVAEKLNQIVFKVLRSANKQDIQRAVEKLFKVEVEHVRVVTIPAKQKRRGTRGAWKKAYVALKAGQEIDFVSL